MAVIDYYDGSTFDLWVLNPNQLVIVPQLKGSIPAIKRLINHIFDTYAEGTIRNYTGAGI
jgi:N-acetylmuramic acid 6-phosphate (MurNAc-6-P) etherase